MQLIYINGYCLSQKFSGIQRFAQNIIEHLDKLNSTHQNPLQMICLVPREVETSFSSIQVKVLKTGFSFIDNKQILWEQLLLPFRTKSNYLINLCNFAPIFKKNQLVVIHDVIPFRYPKICSRLWGGFFRFMTNIFVKRVKHLASVSHFSAEEILAVTHSNREIIVLGNSGEHFNSIAADSEVLNRLNITPGSYILSVSSQAHAAHKNFVTLANVANVVHLPVIAVGAGCDNIQNIQYTGQINDQELKALYENAFVFVFPSLYEGFGIPPLEAFVCGAPVLVSDIEIFHEVCGNAALYFDPASYKDIVNKVTRLQQDASLRKELINKGREQALIYRWDTITCQVFNLLI